MPSIDKKKNTQKNKLIYIFFSVFFITLVVMVYLAQAFAPRIDVDIVHEEVAEEEQEEVVERQPIDESLRGIQEEEFSESPDETNDMVATLKKLKENAIKKQLEVDSIKLKENVDEQSEMSLPYPQVQQNNVKMTIDGSTRLLAPVPANTTKMTKVYVGRYSNFNDAIGVQNALIDALPSISPFVKNLDGVYVVQVGSYASPQKAKALVDNLLLQGFEARMFQE